jgi:virginiamycin B lyase
MPAILTAQQIAIGTYPAVGLYAITAGPDGALWFTASGGIGRMTTAGAVTVYPVPSYGGDAITAGPDGALWFTANSFGIGRITTVGAVTVYPLPTASSEGLWGITAGPDGALWFTEFNNGKIGRITTGGVVTEYPVSAGQPQGITAGPDGALWFTLVVNGFSGYIGRITTGGVVTEYPVPFADSFPQGITVGPDGALWFTDGNSSIGRITTAGVVTAEYPVTGIQNSGSGITAGPDGALWFVETEEPRIGRITTAGVVTLYTVPNGGFGCFVEGITAGPDGALWFTQCGSIGEAVFVTAGLGVSPASGSYRTNLTFTGTAFAPNEIVHVYAYGIGSAVLATATADESGSFTATALQPPLSPYGPRLFLGVGQNSGKLGAASLAVTPRLILEPSSGAAGSTAKVLGFGFDRSQIVQIGWGPLNAATVLGNATTNQSGYFEGAAALTVTIPSGASPGLHLVFGRENPSVIGKAYFKVE